MVFQHYLGSKALLTEGLFLLKKFSVKFEAETEVCYIHRLYHYQSDLYLDSPQSYIHLKPKGSNTSR